MQMPASGTHRCYLQKQTARPVCAASPRSRHQQESPGCQVRHCGGLPCPMLRSLSPGAPHQSLLTLFLIATSVDRTNRRKKVQPGIRTLNRSASSVWILFTRSTQQPWALFAPEGLFLVKPCTSMLGAKALEKNLCAFPYVAIGTTEEHNEQLCIYRKPVDKVSNRLFCPPLVWLLTTRASLSSGFCHTAMGKGTETLFSHTVSMNHQLFFIKNLVWTLIQDVITTNSFHGE